jgi:trans-2,3-dihydro-3-hydroxyanthranilate isomerase
MRLRRKLEYSPSKGNAVAGHPIIGTSWVLMNKILIIISKVIVTVPIGPIPVYQSEGLVWLKAAQPQFFDIFQR